MEIDVLCVGHASYDLIFCIPRHPGPDEKMTADSFAQCGGGPAANAAVTVARLGGTSAFAGFLGTDIYGEKHLQELVQEGVNVDYVGRSHGSTPLSAIFVKPDGQRALVNYRGGRGGPVTQGFDFSNLQPRVLLFDGHEPEISLGLVERAKAGNIPTILDAGSLHSGSRELAGLVDYLICSERFALEYSGEADRAKALAALAECAPCVVITAGDKGVIWSRRGVSGGFPAYPVQAIDTTGAGDVFHGAFAWGLAQGMAWQELLCISSAAAALCCTIKGARPGIPTRAALETFLQRHGH